MSNLKLDSAGVHPSPQPRSALFAIEDHAMHLIDFQAASPYRPPDWRWLRAVAIRSGLLGKTGRPDPWVGRAIRLLDRLAAHDPIISHAGLGPGDRAVLGAYEVRFAADPRPRQLLEARVLAGQPVGAIAASCGLTTGILEAYEAAFFDVRARLRARDYVAVNVLGRLPHEAIDPDDIESLLKDFAFGGGPAVLEAVIGHLRLGGPAGGAAAGARDPGLDRSIDMAIAARAIPVDEKSAPLLIRLHALLMEAERRAAADVATGAPIRAAVEPWVAQANVGGVPPISPPVGPLDVEAAGPGPAPDESAGVAETMAESGPIRPESPMRRTA